MLPQTGERQVAEKLEQIKPNHRQRYGFAIHEIIRLYGRDARINIVDCAMGVGYGSFMLAKTFPNSTVLGLDIHEPAVDVAVKAYHLPNTVFMQCDLSDSERFDECVKAAFDTDNVDVIVSIETIEHVRNDEALMHMYSDTAETLIGSVPNEDVVPFNRDTHPFHFRHYTKQEFTDLLEGAGFHPEVWVTQYDKVPGEIYASDDGMGFVVTARQSEAVTMKGES